MGDEITITRASNGFVINYRVHEYETGEMLPFTHVISEKEGVENDEAVAVLAADLCYWLINYYCLGGSKHDKHRISVEVEEKSP